MKRIAFRISGYSILSTANQDVVKNVKTPWRRFSDGITSLIQIRESRSGMVSRKTLIVPKYKYINAEYAGVDIQALGAMDSLLYEYKSQLKLRYIWITWLGH